MNATLNRPRTRAINPLQLSRVFAFLLLALVVGGAGLCFVSLKNTQHALGERVRETERQLREFRARNQDYQSRIASLSSRVALRRKLESGFIAMIPVPATAIARLTPPAIATEDGAMRTAAVINPLLRP
ncbi:MAG: hypothetical protein PHC88_03135 [Terrimicrobiaceae bacterium]|nr:hypothetical protein [Terrimicrobiaceae bacterium]